MESKLGFNRIYDSTIQMSINWCIKLKRKCARREMGKNENSQQK